jgi:peptidoglycan/LPS O-acetylase OafA/YrhL
MIREQERHAALDGLRAVAVLLVFLYHCRFPVWQAGRLGVDVFFPLSGFLITGLIVGEYRRTSGFEFLRFYLRRGLRLYPALLVTIALTLPFRHAVTPPGTLTNWAESALLAVTYTTDLAVGFNEGYVQRAGLTHTWTLALEEQFYLLWPLLLVAMLRRGWTFRRSAGVAAGLAGASWTALALTSPPIAAFFRPDTRVGGLMVGCAMALAVETGGTLTEPRRRLRLALSLLLAGIAAGSWDSHAHLSDTLGIIFVSLGAAIAVPALCIDNGPVGRFLSQPSMVWFGRRSYGIYLVHLPVIDILRPQLGSRLLVFALAAPITTALVAATYRWVEQPALSLRHRVAA